jgi:hypothetical protein
MTSLATDGRGLLLGRGAGALLPFSLVLPPCCNAFLLRACARARAASNPFI